MRKQNRSGPLTESELAFRQEVADRRRMLEERELAMRNAEHFGVLGAEVERKNIVAWLRREAAAAGNLPVERDLCARAIADAIERGEHVPRPPHPLPREEKDQ